MATTVEYWHRSEVIKDDGDTGSHAGTVISHGGDNEVAWRGGFMRGMTAFNHFNTPGSRAALKPTRARGGKGGRGGRGGKGGRVAQHPRPDTTDIGNILQSPTAGVSAAAHTHAAKEDIAEVTMGETRHVNAKNGNAKEAQGLPQVIWMESSEVCIHCL